MASRVPLIDLRSDIVARPTPAMVAAMLGASGRDMSFGLREDPAQRELEDLGAALLGHEDSLFFPTGTMANQVAVQIFCSPGEAVLVDAESHLATVEAAATTGISSVRLRTLSGTRGHLSPEQVAEALAASCDEHSRRTSLVALENTHNRAGGSVMPVEWLPLLRGVADRHAVSIHLDGARLWNAAVALDRSAADLARNADSVMVSLNKGLGAPLGALLAGRREFVAEAMRVRQMLGGGWRPTAIPAAAGLVALRAMISRLSEDHQHARQLAEGLAHIKGLSVDPSSVVTNIVIVTLAIGSATVSKVVAALAAEGVLTLPMTDQRLRMVLHYDISSADVEMVVKAFEGAVAPLYDGGPRNGTLT